MIKRLERFVLIGFFVIILIIGLWVYKDYGVPWDESFQTLTGVMNHRYIFKGDPALLSYKDRYYGPVFELPLLWVTARLHAPTAVQVRHLLIFLIFFAGLLMFFQLGQRLFRSMWWGLLATLLLTFSPRIFADAFYNSKDIPFLVGFIATGWMLVRLIDSIKKNANWLNMGGWLGLLAGASGVLIGTRVTGVMIIPLSCALLFLSTLETPGYWKRGFSLMGLYLILTICLTILFWPTLWHDPFREFLNAARVMSRYEFWGKAVLYQGKYIDANKLPWHYLPVWIGISTPLIILVGFIPGMIDWINGVVINARGQNNNKWIKTLSDPDVLGWFEVVGWMIIPIFAIYVLHSVLYNGWRQMYFIYPALVLIAVRGLKALFEILKERLGASLGFRLIAISILLLGLVEPIRFIIQYHPFEYVYFNYLAGEPATLRQRFDMDYWGLSYKQAIDYILAHDPDKNIKVYVVDPPGLDYINNGLPRDQSSRLIPVDDPEKARYFISAFNFHPGDYYPSQMEFYTSNVRGIKIIVAYKLH